MRNIHTQSGTRHRPVAACVLLALLGVAGCTTGPVYNAEGRFTTTYYAWYWDDHDHRHDPPHPNHPPRPEHPLHPNHPNHPGPRPLPHHPPINHHPGGGHAHLHR